MAEIFIMDVFVEKVSWLSVSYFFRFWGIGEPASCHVGIMYPHPCIITFILFYENGIIT